MADAPETSFIPKHNMGSVPKRVAPRASFSIFNFIATLVFLAALGLSVGVYLYKNYMLSTANDTKNALVELKSSFNQSDIESLMELDRRVTTAATLLDRHLSPLAVFDALERRTQSGTQFKTFLYSRNESGSAALELEGEVFRFNTLALQGRQLEEDSIFERVIFSNLGVMVPDEEEEPLGGPEKRVSFLVTGLIDTDVIGYTVPLLPSQTESTPLGNIQAPASTESDVGETTQTGDGVSEQSDAPEPLDEPAL